MALNYASINPEVLRWARESSHYAADEFRAKLGSKPSAKRYSDWESGDQRPTMNQLRDIARKLNRPLATFFMVKPPREPQPLKEMRRLPEWGNAQESPELTKQVRLAVERRNSAVALYSLLGERAPNFTKSIDVDSLRERSGIEREAERLRKYLAVSADQQTQWPDHYAAIRAWREALEQRGVLVFQIPAVDLNEMRGFALVHRPLPIVAYNSRDAPRARVFTMLHEFCHVLLGDSFLDSSAAPPFTSKAQTERLCDRLAAAILVPEKTLKENSSGSVRKKWEIAEIETLVNTFKVSGGVVVRRLNDCGLISRDSYTSIRSHYDSFKGDPKTTSGGNSYRNLFAHMGTLIPRLAFRTYYEKKITTSDLSAIFGRKVKLLPEIERLTFGANFAFDA